MVRGQLVVASLDDASAIPRQEFQLVQRRDSAREVAPHKPESMHVKDAEALGISSACAAQLPYPPADDELIARHIERIEGYRQLRRWISTPWTTWQSCPISVGKSSSRFTAFQQMLYGYSFPSSSRAGGDRRRRPAADRKLRRSWRRSIFVIGEDTRHSACRLYAGCSTHLEGRKLHLCDCPRAN